MPDSDRLRWALDHVAEHGFGDHVDADSIIEEAAKQLLDPRYALVHIRGIDVVYAVLDEARDELLQAQQMPGTDNPETAIDYIAPIIDAVLARFPDNDALLKWAGSAIDAHWGGWIDDQHDVWTAEDPDAEDYAETAVQARLGDL